jgi:hypothetical protein
LPEALAVSDNDFVLSERASKLKNIWQKLGAPKTRAARALRRRGRHLTPYLVFGFFAVTFTVILFNALFWQNGRRSGPLLFSHAPPAAAAKGPKNAPFKETAAPKRGQPAPAQDEAPKSPAGKGPQELPQARANVAPPALHDQISEILQATEPAAAPPPAKPAAGAPKPLAPSKAVLNAQRALIKLGFVLKLDGVPGNKTRQAVARYERGHGLAVRGELTPALIRRLSAEAGIALQ